MKAVYLQVFLSWILVMVATQGCDSSSSNDDDTGDTDTTYTDTDTVDAGDTDTNDTGTGDTEETEPCCPASKIINCGHRGTGENTQSNPQPENTISSFQKAAEEGAQMVELDAMHSSDGTLVVIHNDRVDTTTDGEGCVMEKTLEELKALDAASGTSMEGTTIQIPTLEEVLAAVDGDINVEIKIRSDNTCPPSDPVKLAQDVVSLIQADTKDRTIIVSSFNAALLLEVQKLDPSLYLGFISLFAASVETAKKNNMNAFHVKDSDLDKELFDKATSYGLDVNPWTVNEPERIRELMEMGVNMIITDEPDVVESVREEICNPLCEE